MSCLTEPFLRCISKRQLLEFVTFVYNLTCKCKCYVTFIIILMIINVFALMISQLWHCMQVQGPAGVDQWNNSSRWCRLCKLPSGLESFRSSFDTAAHLLQTLSFPNTIQKLLCSAKDIFGLRRCLLQGKTPLMLSQVREVLCVMIWCFFLQSCKKMDWLIFLIFFLRCTHIFKTWIVVGTHINKVLQIHHWFHCHSTSLQCPLSLNCSIITASSLHLFSCTSQRSLTAPGLFSGSAARC